MNPSGYSWTSTSQWSQISGGPQAQAGNGAPMNPPQNNSGYYPQNNGNDQSYNQNNFQGQPQQMNPGVLPETRRDMITRLYRQILGREPDNDGLNYYLYNTQLQEPQIAREMYESTDHQDILKKAKDVREMIMKLEEEKKITKELQLKLANSEALSESYKQLIHEQNQILSQGSGYMNQPAPHLPNTDGNINSNPPQYAVPQQANVDYNQNNYYYDQNEQFYDTYPAQQQYNDEYMINDPFQDDSEPKGLIQKIKNWLKF